MSKARLALALLLLAGCEGRLDLGGTAPDCECVATPPAATDSGAEAPSAPVDSGTEAPSEPDASGAGPDAPVSETGSETSAPVEASANVGPPVYPSWCSNNVKDGDETDVDCGGHCAPCGPRMGCLVDADCSLTAAGCDIASGGCRCDGVAFICIHSHCFDHVKDGDESDGDCGGATCVLCAVGQRCASDADCAGAACDALSLTCIENHCTDHHTNGDESAVDCGGLSCPWCATGQHCSNTGDCAPGHVCFSGSHLCS